MLWGVQAYGLGYLFSLAAFGRRADAIFESATVNPSDGYVSVATIAREAGISSMTGAGWLFYNAHLVPLNVPEDRSSSDLWTDAVNVNPVLQDGGAALALLVVPPLLLVVSGVAVTRSSTFLDLRFGFGGPRARYALNGGLITLLGYLPLAVLGSIVFSVHLGIVTGPDQFLAFALAGLIYPFVFGGIGGLLVSRGAERPSMEERGLGWGDRE